MNKIYQTLKLIVESIIEAKWAIGGKESDSSLHMSLRRYY